MTSFAFCDKKIGKNFLLFRFFLVFGCFFLIFKLYFAISDFSWRQVTEKLLTVFFFLTDK